MRQSELRTEDKSERTHGSRQARLAKEPEALDIRAILRHQPEYSDDARSVECADIEQERPGRPGVRAVDRKHLLDWRQCRQYVPHGREPSGNPKDNGPLRHLA